MNLKLQKNSKGVKYACNQCEYFKSSPTIKTNRYKVSLWSMWVSATTKGHLKWHKESIHECIRYPCDQCQHVTMQTSILKQHRGSKHIRVRYPCDQCEYVATMISNLKRHKESKHEGIRYPCDQCEYDATTPASLKQHKESKHEGIRYPCD